MDTPPHGQLAEHWGRTYTRHMETAEPTVQLSNGPTDNLAGLCSDNDSLTTLHRLWFDVVVSGSQQVIKIIAGQIIYYGMCLPHVALISATYPTLRW